MQRFAIVFNRQSSANAMETIIAERVVVSKQCEWNRTHIEWMFTLDRARFGIASKMYEILSSKKRSQKSEFSKLYCEKNWNDRRTLITPASLNFVLSRLLTEKCNSPFFSHFGLEKSNDDAIRDDRMHSELPIPFWEALRFNLFITCDETCKVFF